MSRLDRAFVVTCEHASHAVPEGERDLGVPPEVLTTHAAWDPGARDVAERVSQALGAPLVAGRFTRLFVDLNRSPSNTAEVIPAACYGVHVPANLQLAPTERAERLRTYHAPYRAEIGAHIEHHMRRRGRCLVLSVHSFTPEIDPDQRRFDVGIMFDRGLAWEARAVGAMEGVLARHGRTSRRNLPYDGQDDSVLTEFRNRWPGPRFIGIEVELNQRMMAGAGWAEGIADALAESVIASWDA